MKFKIWKCIVHYSHAEDMNNNTFFFLDNFLKIIKSTVKIYI